MVTLITQLTLLTRGQIENFPFLDPLQFLIRNYHISEMKNLILNILIEPANSILLEEIKTFSLKKLKTIDEI